MKNPFTNKEIQSKSLAEIIGSKTTQKEAANDTQMQIAHLEGEIRTLKAEISALRSILNNNKN